MLSPFRRCKTAKMAYTAVGMKTIIPDTPKAAMLPSACESSAKGYAVTLARLPSVIFNRAKP